MEDSLLVFYDKDEKCNEAGLAICRHKKDGSYTVLKMLLNKEADDLYKLLINQKEKVVK